MKFLLLSAFVLIVSSVNLVAETVRYKSCSFSGLEKISMDFMLWEMKDVDRPKRQTFKFLCNNMPNTSFEFFKTDNIKNAPLKVKANGCNFTVNQFIKNRKFHIAPTKSMRKCGNKKIKKDNYTFWSNKGKEFNGECSNGRTFSGLRDSNAYYIVSASSNGNGRSKSKDKAIRDACGF